MVAVQVTDFAPKTRLHADYDGTQWLRDYLKHFEHCSVVNGWNQEEAALFLAAGLRGEAQKVLNGMSDSDCRNYAKIVDKLELRFGVEKQRELHQVRLHNRHQLENESVQALAADIRSLSSLACELEAFCLVDGDERRSPLQVRSVDEVDKEPDLLKAQLDMLRSDIRVQ